MANQDLTGSKFVLTFDLCSLTSRGKESRRFRNSGVWFTYFLSMRSALFCASLLLFCRCAGQTTAPDLTDQETVRTILISEMKRLEMTSLSFAVVKSDRLLWAETMGYADRGRKIPASVDTRYLLASISKVVCAIAVMQLHEQGHFSLNDDIGPYLPFTVRHPRYPEVPITFRMLLTHSSSIVDKGYWDYNTYCAGCDHPLSLLEYYTQAFDTNGQFHTDDHFSTHRPGSSYEYSSFAHALLALLIERISGLEYDRYCAHHIFEPLRMTKSTFRLSQTPLDEVAISYPGAPVFEMSTPHYTKATYPESGLRSSVTDLARLLSALIPDGSVEGVGILKPATIELMQRSSISFTGGRGVGLTLQIEHLHGLDLVGHSGGESGVSTAMYFNPQTNTGFILLNNDSFRLSTTAALALLRWGEAQ